MHVNLQYSNVSISSNLDDAQSDIEEKDSIDATESKANKKRGNMKKQNLLELLLQTPMKSGKHEIVVYDILN